jgi:hypothetical protein
MSIHSRRKIKKYVGLAHNWLVVEIRLLVVAWKIKKPPIGGFPMDIIS